MNYKHDCNKCIHLYSSNDTEYVLDSFFDIYWCKNPRYPNLDSVIARYGNKNYEYISTHPPEAFADPDPDHYVKQENNWYRLALKLAKEKGLYKGKY